MTLIRRKGVAIVDTPKGILVVSGRKRIFSLPGGGADRKESREKTAIRELEEETNLKTKRAKFLFSYIGSKWKSHNGKLIRNNAKVFLIKSYGTARPRHEIKHIDYWNYNCGLKISHRTQKLIDAYLEMKKNGKLSTK